MKKPFAAVACIIAAITFVWQLSELRASTNGTQTFEFLGRSGATLWVAEDIGGEYCQSRLHHIVTADGQASLGTSYLQEYAKWQPVQDLLKHLEMEKAVPLKKLPDGSLILEDGQIKLAPPPADPALTEQFHEHIRTGGSNALTWTQETGRPRIQPPLLNGRPAPTLCRLPEGLYINYSLDRAWYFPRSRQILLFTTQPVLAVGLDTLHGLLLLNAADADNNGKQ